MSKSVLNSLLFAVYVTTSAVGLLMLKGSLGRIRAANGSLFTLSPNMLMLAAGFGLYIVSFVVWIRILSRMPLSTAYPIAIGLTLAFSTTGAVLLLGERLSGLKLAGILFVFLGCLALSRE